MRLVVDASVAVLWFVAQTHAPHAIRLLDDAYRLAAPDFMLVEMANVLWKLRRRKELNGPSADAAMRNLEAGDIEYLPTPALLGRARTIAETLDHPVYDCIYLAATEAAQAPVVTADRRFFDRASKGGWQDRVLWIEDVPPIP